MKKIILLTLVISIGLPVAASAEFYQYTDDKGHIRFTDDLGQVQAFMRKRVRIYRESTSKQAVSSAAVSVPLTPKSPQTMARATKPGKHHAPTWRQLETDRKTLGQQFRIIAQKRRELARQRNTVRSDSAARRYNRDVRLLNAMIKRFERKRQALNGRVVAYNRAVRSRVTDKTKIGLTRNGNRESFALAQN